MRRRATRCACGICALRARGGEGSREAALPRRLRRHARLAVAAHAATDLRVGTDRSVRLRLQRIGLQPLLGALLALLIDLLALGGALRSRRCPYLAVFLRAERTLLALLRAQLRARLRLRRGGSRGCRGRRGGAGRRRRCSRRCVGPAVNRRPFGLTRRRSCGSLRSLALRRRLPFWRFALRRGRALRRLPLRLRGALWRRSTCGRRRASGRRGRPCRGWRGSRRRQRRFRGRSGLRLLLLWRLLCASGQRQCQSRDQHQSGGQSSPKSRHIPSSRAHTRVRPP